MKMKVTSLAMLVALRVGIGHTQQAPPQPKCNSYVVQKTVTERPKDFSFKQRSCTYLGKLISGQAFFGPLFMGGVAQFRDDPIEWGQGMKGYLRRVGTRYAQGVAKSTGEFVVSSVLRENPRYEPSTDTHFWKRAGHGLASAFVVRHLRHCDNDDTGDLSHCHRWPALSRMIGAASSGVVGLAWYPDRLNTPGQILARTGSAYGGYVASGIFSEFQADIFRLFGKLVGSDKSPSAKFGNTKGEK